jgi:two-component system, cell cycle sensor histidine kinase and response regulator CckA
MRTVKPLDLSNGHIGAERRPTAEDSATMKRFIQVLHLEDNAQDAELIQANLERGGLGCKIDLVSGKAEFESALARDMYDVILCDHDLPDYDGRSAIKSARERLPLVPIISLSGTLGEEEAVECLKQGATDYVLKHRIERLVPAVRRALQEVEERRARLQAETASRTCDEQFRAMFEVASIGMAQADPRTGQWLRVNQKMCAITGYSAAELLGLRVSELTHPDDRQKDWEMFQRVVRGEADNYRLEKRYVRKEGTVVWVNVNMSVIRDAAGQPTRTMATIEDITERKQSVERVHELNLVLRATGAVSALILRERDPQQLLAEASQILVDTRGYRFVWIGLVEAGSKRVAPQARAGKDTGYFDSLAITWDETPQGRGPIGTAIRTGQWVVCQEIAIDPRLAQWREDARARGVASLAAIPMIYGSRVLGAVAVYSEHAGAFDAEELELLNELAGKLAFALQSIEQERERKRAEGEREANLRGLQGINQLHQSLLAPAPLEDKLRSVTDNIVRLFGADFCRIWLIRPGDLCERGCVHAGVVEGPDVCRYRDLCLHLVASSGRYTRTDGKVHCRVPFGAYKIGRIASGEDHKFLTNDVKNDSLVHDPEWARELGLVSFAGYQLRIPGVGTLGVLALFAKHPILSAEDNLLDGLSSALAQVIQQAQAEATLQQKEEYFRALTEGTSDVTTLVNAEGIIRYESPSVEQLFGFRPADLIGRNAFEFVHPDDLARVQQALAQALAIPGSSTRLELRFRHKDGSWRVLEATTRNLLDDPNVKGIVINSRDSTERNRLVEALSESSQFNQQIVASAEEGIIVYGRDQKYQVWNPFMEQLTGMPANQVLGKNPEELFPFLREAGVLGSIQKALAGEPTASLEFHFRTLLSVKSGWVNQANAPLRNGAGEIIGVIGIVRDITERKRTQESHARLVTAVEQSVETIVITDASSTILYANPAFERTSGYTRAEALGQTPRILKSGQHDAEFYGKMWAVLSRGEVWSGRLINKKKDGALYEEDATISPMRDPSGKVINYVAVKRDVTHEAELEAQLRQAQKMEAVGQLAGGVAHDFNNMLAIIRGNAELLLMEEGQLTANALEGLKHVVAASERAANLTRQLLAFSRKQVLQPQPLMLNEVITNLTRMLKRVIGEHIDLQCHYAVPLPYVQADTGMMEQVILNLVVNARDAMPEGGQLRVTTEHARIDEARAHVHPGACAGEFVCVLVSDTGTGIAPEILPRIFEPFFTTKEVGKGTGLGLATVYGIVEQHGGWMEVSSQVGEGSTFKVFLPSIANPVGLDAAAEAGADIRGGKETILLVEDDLAVRLTTRRILECKGYKIREAMNGREALEQWQSHAGEIAMLLTDIIMPDEMTGRDLAERLWGQRPGLKVIFMSGYSADVLGTNTEFLRRTKSRFLTKPCSSRTLLEAVRQCLDGKEPSPA